MTINEYQEKAVSFAQYGGNAMYPALGLAEEAGEVAGKIAKFIRKHGGLGPDTAARSFPHAFEDDIRKFTGDLKKELGDVCWMTAALAHEYGLSLEEIMEGNIEKLADRKDKGLIIGEGDTNEERIANARRGNR